MNKKIIIALLIAVALFGTFLLFQHKDTDKKEISASKDLTPVSSITHGHGLAVDAVDSNKLYIATHHGLLVLKNEKDLFQVGTVGDDYMGFSPHPKDPKILFSSGHPEAGGNIGFQKSEDGGFNWKKLSDGIDGPVDFHAIAVSPVNPDLIFGWYQGSIQISTDGGQSWEISGNTKAPFIGLAADPKDENIVYAASPQGLMVSKNKGKDFSILFDGFVSTIAINPGDSQQLISFSEKYKLARSNDSGKTWEPAKESFNGETPLHTAFDRQRPEIVFILTEKNSIYKSVDGGATWKKIR